MVRPTPTASSNGCGACVGAELRPTTRGPRVPVTHGRGPAGCFAHPQPTRPRLSPFAFRRRGSKSLACRADSESAVRLADLCVGERPDTGAMGEAGDEWAREARRGGSGELVSRRRSTSLCRRRHGTHPGRVPSGAAGRRGRSPPAPPPAAGPRAGASPPSPRHPIRTPSSSSVRRTETPTGRSRFRSSSHLQHPRHEPQHSGTHVLGRDPRGDGTAAHAGHGGGQERHRSSRRPPEQDPRQPRCRRDGASRKNSL